MCCWPFIDVFYEENPKKKKKKKKEEEDPGVLYMDPISNTLVKLTGIKENPAASLYQIPMVAQPQPVYQQPMVAAQSFMPAASAQYSAYGQPIYANPPFAQPALGTYGYTGSEMLAQQMAFAQNADMGQKQEMKPADDDKFRMYWCREQDGSWTQRNRLTIDSGDIGECRWYASEGMFYVVRLSDG